MKRTEQQSPQQSPAVKKPAPEGKVPGKKRVEWVPYLPAIIMATTALVEVLLKHFHPC